MSLEADIAEIKMNMEKLLALMTPKETQPMPIVPPLTQEDIDACLLRKEEYLKKLEEETISPPIV
jgi:hypothetical protein